MKYIILFFSTLTIGLYSTVSKQHLEKSTGIKLISACDSVPFLNKNVLAFVKTKIGKKVGKGECWDLAAEALNTYNAKWDGKYKFGKEINYKTECVFPGDIIQFEGILLKYDVGDKHFTEKLAHHTAVIYEVKNSDDYIMADQNTGRSGKKVGLSPLKLSDITKGKFKIFRPAN